MAVRNRWSSCSALLRFTADAMRAVAIDVGGTKTAIGIVDTITGNVLTVETMSSPGHGDNHRMFFDHLAASAEGLAQTYAASVAGLSICELVDLEGNITSHHRIDWRGLPVRARLSRLVPATIEADVRAAARAESRFGAGLDLGSFFYVNIGTGISSAFVVDGRIHAGARGNALALASSAIELRCPHCGEIASQVLEDIAGGEGLLREASRHGLPVTTAAELFSADAGAAVKLSEAAALGLGVTLGIAVNLLDPQALVLGGGLILASTRYREMLEQQLRRHIWSPATRSLPILPAKLGPQSALVGAALAAADAVARQ